jgi:hypothetical protein
MRKLRGIRELTRRMNHGLNCPRCDQPITRLAAHVNSHGRPHCQLKSAYDKQVDAWAAEWDSRSSGHSS